VAQEKGAKAPFAICLRCHVARRQGNEGETAPLVCLFFAAAKLARTLVVLAASSCAMHASMYQYQSVSRRASCKSCMCVASLWGFSHVKVYVVCSVCPSGETGVLELGSASLCRGVCLVKDLARARCGIEPGSRTTKRPEPHGRGRNWAFRSCSALEDLLRRVLL